MAKNYFWPRGAQQRIPRFARIYQTLAHRIWVPPLVLPSAEQGRATLCPVSLALASVGRYKHDFCLGTIDRRIE
jgi:hypothetical protein